MVTSKQNVRVALLKSFTEGTRAPIQHSKRRKAWVGWRVKTWSWRSRVRSDLLAAGFKLPLKDRTSRLAGKYKSSDVGSNFFLTFFFSFIFCQIFFPFAFVFFVFYFVLVLMFLFLLLLLVCNIVSSILSHFRLLISVKCAGRGILFLFNYRHYIFGFELGTQRRRHQRRGAHSARLNVAGKLSCFFLSLKKKRFYLYLIWFFWVNIKLLFCVWVGFCADLTGNWLNVWQKGQISIIGGFGGVLDPRCISVYGRFALLAWRKLKRVCAKLHFHMFRLIENVCTPTLVNVSQSTNDCSAFPSDLFKYQFRFFVLITLLWAWRFQQFTQGFLWDLKG